MSSSKENASSKQGRHAALTALARAAKQSKGVTALMIVAIVASVVVGLIPPLVLKQIVQTLVDGSLNIVAPAACYIGVLIASCLLASGQEALITMFGQKTMHALRSQMSSKLTRMESPYFSNTSAGEIASRIVNDVDAVEELLSSGVIGMLSDLISIVGILIIVFTMSKGLFVILLIALPLIFMFTRFCQKRMRKAQMQNREAIAMSSVILPETVDNIRSIRNNHGEEFMERRYGNSIERGFQAIKRNALFDSIYSPIVLTVSSGIIAIMMALCVQGAGWLTWFGMSVGTAVALISYVGQIFGPLQSLGMEIQNIQQAAASLQRIDEFMSLPERVVVEGPLGERNAHDAERDVSNVVQGSTAASAASGVCVSHIDFGYPDGPQIFHDFSLEVEPGEMVTIAGRTGSGKSTLFKLILGLYKPGSGSISVCGIDVDDIAENDRRGLITCVEQEFSMVPGTIRDQITLGNPQITEEDVRFSLECVGLWDVVCGMSRGVDTPCDQTLLSRGQFQLLSIARAVATNPKVILLDEITANLDSQTEKQVIEALKGASAGRTTISISHRLYENAGGRIVIIGE